MRLFKGSPRTPNPRELIRSFEVAAGAHGCRTGNGGRGGGDRPSVVTVYGDEGTTAVLAFPYASETRVGVGCE